jgi:2'-5' RNA ligase
VRLFVGLWPSQDAVDDLRSMVVKLQRTVSARSDQDGPLRWTHPMKWHLTLAFLGETSQEQLPDLERRLARAAARHPALTLELTGGGRFGDRVLYTKIDGDHERLGRLAASVNAAARRAGLSLEQRPYRPHLTLARGRPGCDLRPLAAMLDGYQGPPWTSTEIHLVRSTLAAGPQHASAHETIRSWPLTGHG